MRSPVRSFVLGAVVVLAVTACGKKAEPPAAAPATATTLAPLPAATGEPIFDIANGSGASPLGVDLATLDGMANRTYTVTEPFEEKRIAFKGVDLWSVLQRAGVPTTAKTVHIVALDDYKIDLSVAELRKGGIILATKADGEPIPLDHGGPSRVIFLEGVDAGANPDRWIWSVSHITVS